jgi:hypothetical protein
MAERNDEIRVAVLCKGYSFESWEAECIRQVQALPFVKIVLLIEEAADEIPAPGFFSKLLRYPYRQLLWRFYKRFSLKIPATEIINLEGELKYIPLVRVKPELKGKYSQHFSAADLAKVKAEAPDVILRFGFNILRGEILTVAKYGIWSFHHADEQTIRGGPGAFWEIYNRIPVTGAILQRLTEKLDGGIILRKGFFPTISRSFKANLDQLLNGTTSWMKQALIDIHCGNLQAVEGKPVQTKAPVYTFPRNGQMISAWWKAKSGKISFHARLLFLPEKWNVGIVRQDTGSLLKNGITVPVEWLPEAPTGEYYADPFGWKENGRLTIIAEHYRYRKDKGDLSVFTNGEQQHYYSHEKHLSYPFVLSENSRRFIIPECAQSDSLFVLDETLQPKTLLSSFPAIDASPVFYQGKWWLFTSKEGLLSNTGLYIFHSARFDGNWQPHANNPVKFDIRSSRMAGTPFVRDGKLYRPSQDCSTTYGAAVVIHEVTALSETEFAETTIQRLEPQRGWKWNRGLHTLSVVDEETLLIDAKRYAFNFDNFGRAFRRKMRRFFRR